MSGNMQLKSEARKLPNYKNGAKRFLELFKESPKSATMAARNVILSKIRSRLIVIASKSGFLASLYFTFFSRRFYREHMAVLAGIRKFQAHNIAHEQSSAQLRRNIHRLEKALIMPNRRSVFAEDYIAQTVTLFNNAVSSSELDSGELKWADDVLTLYFSSVSDTPVTAPCRESFLGGKSALASPPSVPYASAERQNSSISFEQLSVFFKKRRSVRWYEPEPVPSDLIEKAINIAAEAPSACNRQPFSFVIFGNGAEATKIANLAGGTGGFADNIPCLLVVLGDLSNYTEERDRHLIYIDGALASMQLMLALQTLGLSTCAINWPDIEARERDLKKMLSLQDYERAIMLISVGYARPDGQIPFSQKKQSNLLMREIDIQE